MQYGRLFVPWSFAVPFSNTSFMHDLWNDANNPVHPASAADYPVGAATPITVRNGNGHCNVRINKRIQR